MRKCEKYKYDYSYLRGFVYSNKSLRNLIGLANMLNIKSASLHQKLNNETSFSQHEIMLIKETFNLSNEEIIKMFFTKENKDE